MKTCTKCNEIKELSEFNLRSDTKSIKYRSHCKECCEEYKRTPKRKLQISEYGKEYKINNKEQITITGRKHRLKKFYKLSPEEYNIMLIKQNGVCAICKKHETKVHPTTGKIISLTIDHNHETNKVRGLLCCACNLMIGNAKENITIMANGIQYLEETNK